MKWIMTLCLLLCVVTLASCSEVQNEYYEVHIIVVEDQLFHFVNPGEGTASIAVKFLEDQDSQFIYLYEPIDGEAFSYTHYFSTIQTQFVYTDRRDGKHYIQANQDINTWVNQYFLDKAEWEANPS